MRQAFLLILIGVVLGSVSLTLNPGARAVLLNAPLGDEISVSEVNAHVGEILWIDARSLGAFEDGHVRGSLPLNEDNWNEHFVTVIERWAPGTMVVVYCDGAACRASRKVADRLRTDAGISPVRVLKGDWTAAKGTP